MVEFTVLNSKNKIYYRIFIRTSEIREVIENADGTARLRLTDVSPKGDFASVHVAEKYEEAVKIIEDDQYRHLSRLGRKDKE